jgi:hypothetical protein
LARPGPTAALAASIALHLAAGYAVGRLSWGVAEDERRVLHVVWINERPRAAAAVLPRADETGPLSVEEPPQAEPREPPPAPAPPADTPPTEEAEPGNRTRSAFLPPRIDWEKERKDAVAKVLEEIAREDGYITFSTDELFEEPPAAAPNPREKIFDSPQRGRSRSALTPGQARSRFGNRVAELCNALTGGFGISLFGFGVGTVCADAGPEADFFADIRPAYMNSLPVCVETRDPLLNPVGSNEFPTIKCRLVEKDELE